MKDKNGFEEAMGRQQLALLHFTKCPAETFVSRAFVSLSPKPLESVPSEQTATPGDLLSHLPGPWMMEGPSLFLTRGHLLSLCLCLQKHGEPVPGAWPTEGGLKV